MLWDLGHSVAFGLILGPDLAAMVQVGLEPALAAQLAPGHDPVFQIQTQDWQPGLEHAKAKWGANFGTSVGAPMAGLFTTVDGFLATMAVVAVVAWSSGTQWLEHLDGS